MAAQTYSECIRTLLEPSLALMDRMQEDGLDLNRPRLVTHLLIGSQEDVMNAAAEASANGFSVTEQTGGRLVISETVPIIKDWMMHTLPVMCSFAEEKNLTYDGWDVDVSQDGLRRE